MNSKEILLPNNKLIEFYYYSENNSSVINSIKNGKIWEKKLYDIYKKILNKKSIVVDIGAFIGSHTACFSTLAKEVYAFEPCSKPYNCITKTINENNLDNIFLFNCALSDKKQEKILMTNYDGDSRFKEHTNKKNWEHSEKIMCRSLDEFKLSEVHLIKIDTEKHEWNVLEGARETIKRSRPVILLETFKSKSNLNKLDEWTKDNNYWYLSLKGDDYILIPTNNENEDQVS